MAIAPLTRDEQALAQRVLTALLRPRAQPPQLQQRFDSIGAVHAELRVTFGFKLVEKKSNYGGPRLENGLPVAPLLLWRNGRLIVRVKTRGEPATAKFRQGLAHLSLCLIDGRLDANGKVDTSFGAELGKFNYLGVLQPKLPPNQAHPPTPAQKAAGETWADNTHFLFPDLVCDDSDVDALTVETA